MVARNFSLQDLPYARLLQVSDEDREFLSLEELKPHQLTVLSGSCAINGESDNGLRSTAAAASINRGLSATIQIGDKVGGGKEENFCGKLNNKFIVRFLQHSVSNIGGNGQVDGNGMIAYGGNAGNTNGGGVGSATNQQVYYDLNTQQTTK